MPARVHPAARKIDDLFSPSHRSCEVRILAVSSEKTSLLLSKPNQIGDGEEIERILRNKGTKKRRE